MMATAETAIIDGPHRGTSVRPRDRKSGCAGLAVAVAAGCWRPEAPGVRPGSPRCCSPRRSTSSRGRLPIGVSALGRLAPQGEVIKVAAGQRRRRRAGRPAAGRCRGLGASRAGRGDSRPVSPPRGRGPAGAGAGRRRPGQAGAGEGRAQARGSPGQGSADQAIGGRGPCAAERDLGRASILLETGGRLAPGPRRPDPQV